MVTISSPITEIISDNPLLECVVERFGFEKKKHTLGLQEICAGTNNDPHFVLEVLKAFSEDCPFPSEELKKFPIAAIIHYLRETHTFYLDKKIPEIELSFTGLSKNYSFSHPQLLILANLFMDYKKDLIEHVEFEEYIFFPYILELLKVKNHKKELKAYGLDKYSIALFIQEHHHEEAVLTSIRASIEKKFKKTYTPLPFKVFLNQIKSLEKDLLIHARIEDEVLLPMALLLEKEVKNN